MAYTFSFSIALGEKDTGLTLRGQLTDTTGANAGGTFTAGFVEVGAGVYGLTTSIPDAHRGFVVVMNNADGAKLAQGVINPEQGEQVAALEGRVTAVRAERIDAAISSRSNHSATAVNDIITTAHGAGAYNLTAAQVWAALTSALTTVGSIGKLIVDYLNAAITSRAATGAQMDLVAAPNATAVTAIQSGLALEATLEASTTAVGALIEALAIATPEEIEAAIAAVHGAGRYDLATMALAVQISQERIISDAGDVLLIRGDTPQIVPFIFSDADTGALIDPTAWNEWWLTVKPISARDETDDTAAVVSVEGVPGDADSGAVTFTITDASAMNRAANYDYDVEARTDAGAVRTFVIGTARLAYDVRQGPAEEA